MISPPPRCTWFPKLQTAWRSWRLKEWVLSFSRLEFAAEGYLAHMGASIGEFLRILTRSKSEFVYFNQQIQLKDYWYFWYIWLQSFIMEQEILCKTIYMYHTHKPLPTIFAPLCFVTATKITRSRHRRTAEKNVNKHLPKPVNENFLVSLAVRPCLRKLRW